MAASSGLPSYKQKAPASGQSSSREGSTRTRDCLRAVKQWLGCETVAEIGLVREEHEFKLTVLNYGASTKKVRVVLFSPRRRL